MCYKRGNYIKYGLQILRISVSVFGGDLACACADVVLYIEVLVENKCGIWFYGYLLRF